ncbi:MAG: MATE family efflux transporter [Clostridia bacterium]|nr:MATE family efflux transporter [Clostridia bacterium]MBR3975068.1 MATE family efflux transporter [Clostridia bacterium]
MGIKKYIGDRAFYKTAMTVAMPIMLQNLITNLVNMLDNLMVGSIGTEEMSGVAIVNQLLFIFNLAVFGAMGGVGIFTAQFFGKGDNEGIRYSFRYKIIISVCLALVAIGIFCVFDENLISLYLHDVEAGADIAETLGFAKQYMALMLIGLIPFAISQAFSGTMRETGDTFAPMVIGLTAVVTNCVFNYLLIFGKLGFPVLGVRGAAIATVISRFLECILVIAYMLIRKNRFSYMKGLFSSLYIPADTFAAITRKGMPLLLNEVLWSMSMSTLGIAYSLHGITVVAAYNISSTVTNLFNMAFLSLGSSLGIIVGKLLGAGKYEEAVDTDRKLIAFSMFVSVIMGTSLFIVSGYFPGLYNTTDEVKQIATYLIRVCACTGPIVSFANAAYFTLRSGGKTVVTFIFDSGSMWILSVPIAFMGYYVFGLSIFVIFPIVQLLEIVKVILGAILIKKRVWVNNIVE